MAARPVVPRYFFDTSYFVAILSPRDDAHSAAMRLTRQVDQRGAQFYTTDAVLFETLAAFSLSGVPRKRTATDYVQALFASSRWHIVEVTRELTTRALALYAARLDQPYSLCDCLSMVIWRDFEIGDVVTTDGDFAHEGFRALLT